VRHSARRARAVAIDGIETSPLISRDRDVIIGYLRYPDTLVAAAKFVIAADTACAIGLRGWTSW
jgi:hypothetical protein